jgi:hypothetical protein
VNKEATPNLDQLADTLSGTWKGEYRCAQGLTGLDLVIWVKDETTLLATFNFYPVSSNPGVPRGSYAMKGTYASSVLELKGDYWINPQPAGYRMVDLTAPLSSQRFDELAGTVVGCNNFELRKASKDTYKPPV